MLLLVGKVLLLSCASLQAAGRQVDASSCHDGLCPDGGPGAFADGASLIQLSLGVSGQQPPQNQSRKIEANIVELDAPGEASKEPVYHAVLSDPSPTFSQGIHAIIVSYHEPLYVHNALVSNDGNVTCTVTWIIVGAFTLFVLAGYYEWKERRRVRRGAPVPEPQRQMSLETWAIILSFDLMSAVSSDFYIPMIPLVMKELNSPAYLVAHTLLANLMMKAAGALCMGILAERWGRVPVFFLGSALYSVCALGCSTAPTAVWLITLRSFQGLGEASCDISLAVMRDVLKDPSERIHKNALRWSIRNLVPVAACCIGGPLGAVIGWRNFMLCLAAWGLINNIAVTWLLQETRPPEAVSRNAVGSSLCMSLLTVLQLLTTPVHASCMAIIVLLSASVYSTLAVISIAFESFFNTPSGIVAALLTSIPLITLFFPSLFISQLARRNPPVETLKFGMLVQLSAMAFALVFTYYAAPLSLLPGHAACLAVVWLLLTAVGLTLAPFEVVFSEGLGHSAGVASGVQAMLKTVLGSGIAVAMMLFVEAYREQGMYVAWSITTCICQALFWGVLLRCQLQAEQPKASKGVDSSAEEPFEASILSGH